jgi:8-oxo-dGTP pyrophosphatase MutT (NUDIX family)
MNARIAGRVRDTWRRNIQIRRDSGFRGEIDQARTDSESTRIVRLAHLRRLRECHQVAAVCYRVRDGEIEFLLVKTRGGRWTFPKGSAEPGLTHAQAAALEAFEEAGVHGRMEEASFTRYLYRKRGSAPGAPAELAVSAHLCEVRRLETPEEANRNPTWFSAGNAKRNLRDDHKAGSGAEMARVIDRAVRRVRRLQEEVRAMAGASRGPQVIDIDDLRQRVRAGRVPEIG